MTYLVAEVIRDCSAFMDITAFLSKVAPLTVIFHCSHYQSYVYSYCNRRPYHICISQFNLFDYKTSLYWIQVIIIFGRLSMLLL